MTTPQAVIVTRREEIGIIEIENPPVNALARPVRQALLVAIENLDADHGVRAIVIHGRGRHFIAGADVREFNASPLAPLLNDVLLRLEAASKPVVAAMHGTTLGGGAELSLASHYRCAAPDLSFGLPEAKLGLLPGSGGTVRLPRVAGTERALDFMLSGTPVNLASAQTLGVVDHVLDGDILSGAVAYARELVRTGAKVRRVCELPVPAPANPVLFSERRAGLSAAARRVPANLKIIEAVEAAVALPFRPALARTRELFEECRLSRQSQALRHLFFAERGAGTAGAGARPVARIGIIGAGTMGSGIAMSAATAGYVVTLVDLQAPALAMGLARVKQTMEDSARKGRMTAAAADEAIGRVSGATSLEALSDVDLVIEAVFEKLDVKQSVFRELGRICRADAVLASNTSTLDIDTIAVASGRAGSVIGMHFFSPANIMRLLEIVRGRDTAAEVTATALTVAKRLGKIGIVVGNCFGFVGNRMLYAYGREKELMLLEGASPEQIDRALEGFGMAMGPNAVGDLAGLDIGYSVRREWRDRPDDPRFYRASDLLVESGRLGQKSGGGFYRYEAGARRGIPDPEVAEMIRTEAGRLGVDAREIGDAEIVERCMLALINEGARILDEGIATSAAEIDAIWCNGYGFPRDRGGPMFHAETLGLVEVLARTRHYGATLGERYWSPANLLERLAASGRTFDSEKAPA